MSPLTFDYSEFENARMPVGYRTKYLPLAYSVRMTNPQDTARSTPWLEWIPIDSGCEITMFERDWGESIGIELFGEFTTKWRGEDHRTWLGKVALELADDDQTWTWHTTVAFVDFKKNLLGYRGCLEYLDAHFLGVDRTIKLFPINLPGTV